MEQCQTDGKERVVAVYEHHVPYAEDERERQILGEEAHEPLKREERQRHVELVKSLRERRQAAREELGEDELIDARAEQIVVARIVIGRQKVLDDRHEREEGVLLRQRRHQQRTRDKIERLAITDGGISARVREQHIARRGLARRVTLEPWECPLDVLADLPSAAAISVSAASDASASAKTAGVRRGLARLALLDRVPEDGLSS